MHRMGWKQRWPGIRPRHPPVSGLLLEASPDPLTADDDACAVKHKAHSDDRKGRGRQAIDPGQVSRDVQEYPGRDQAHGTKHERLVRAGRGVPKFIQHPGSLAAGSPERPADTWSRPVPRAGVRAMTLLFPNAHRSTHSSDSQKWLAEWGRSGPRLGW